LESFFRFETIGFVVLDQHANIGFATQGILDELGVNGKQHLTFQDVFAEPGFDTFLQDIDFQNTRDQKVTLNLRLNNKSKTKRKFMVVAGSKENEDGTFNIFVIQKQ
jgi:beta-galactosidase/beta-glucuronidase